MRPVLLILLLMSTAAWGTNYEKPKTNSNTQTVNTSSQSLSGAAASARSGSNSTSGVVNSVDVSTGESQSSARVSQGSVTLNNVEEVSAASAASLFTQVCQTGGSAQGIEGGFSIVNGDQFCDLLRMAAVSLVAYEREVSQAPCHVVACTIECQPTSYVTAEMQECPPTELAKTYLAEYHHNLSMAQALLTDTEGTAKFDRFTGQLYRAIGIILLIVFL